MWLPCSVAADQSAIMCAGLTLCLSRFDKLKTIYLHCLESWLRWVKNGCGQRATRGSIQERSISYATAAISWCISMSIRSGAPVLNAPARRRRVFGVRRITPVMSRSIAQNSRATSSRRCSDARRIEVKCSHDFAGVSRLSRPARTFISQWCASSLRSAKSLIRTAS